MVGVGCQQHAVRRRADGPDLPAGCCVVGDEVVRVLLADEHPVVHQQRAGHVGQHRAGDAVAGVQQQVAVVVGVLD